MTTVLFTNGAIRLPSTLAMYMYSPFPVIVETTAWESAKLIVYCAATGRSHKETRKIYNGIAEFDLSRIAQLLVPDVTEVFEMNLSQAGEASPYVTLECSVESLEGDTFMDIEIFGVYGAMDALEPRFEKQRRRIWMNYPQTLQTWKDYDDAIKISGDYVDGSFYPDLLIPDAANMVELSLPLLFTAPALQSLKTALLSGQTADIQVSCRFGGTDSLSAKDVYDLTLVPDLTPRGEGTYLRWLHRDGTFGYWCFRNGAQRANAALHSTFYRHIEGNPAEPLNGVYHNGLVQSFSEARQVSLGTKCDSTDEYDYLCGLATSPVVERLIEGTDRWQRVSVVPGSYTRNIRRNTPSLQDFEITIELPERNTVTP